MAERERPSLSPLIPSHPRSFFRVSAYLFPSPPLSLPILSHPAHPASYPFVSLPALLILLYPPLSAASCLIRSARSLIRHYPLPSSVPVRVSGLSALSY
jgi:hypothetical protein